MLGCLEGLLNGCCAGSRDGKLLGNVEGLEVGFEVGDVRFELNARRIDISTNGAE